MKTLNYVNLMLLFVLSLSFTSCGDEIYYDDEYLKNSDAKLCGNRVKDWIETYEYNNKLYEHILSFNLDGRGNNTLKIYNKLPNGQWNEDPSLQSVPFTWKWMNDMEGLQLNYFDSISYFDNVWVRENYLSGVLDGEKVTFIDINKF